MMFFIMGSRSRVYPDEVYTKVFPGLPTDNLITLEAGHWVHFDKPLETLDLIEQFLGRIDNP